MAAAGCGRKGAARIGVIAKATSHLFFVSIHRGVEAAAKEFGVEAEWSGPNEETEHGRQIQILDAMVARGMDGIAISATDERALAAPVERAIAAGIPVVVFDSAVQAVGFVSFIATDNLGAGRTAARRLVGLVGGKGKVAMVMHKPGGASTGQREAGFIETMAAEFPGVEIAAKNYGMSDLAKSRAVAENFMTGNPDLAGIFCSSEASSIGTIQAIRAREVGGKLKLVTFDSSEAHVEALRDGVINVMLVQDPYRIGYETVKALTEKLRGGTPAARLDLPVREVVRADLEKPEVVRMLAGKG